MTADDSCRCGPEVCDRDAARSDDGFFGLIIYLLLASTITAALPGRWQWWGVVCVAEWAALAGHTFARRRRRGHRGRCLWSRSPLIAPRPRVRL